MAATRSQQLNPFGAAGSRPSIHEVVSYPGDASCTDGGLDRDGTEAFDVPRTRWRGSSDDCEATTSGLRSTTIWRRSLRREGSCWIFKFYWFFVLFYFETANPKPPCV